MMYLGDYNEDGLVDFKWSTNDSPGGSITRATNGTVSVYKANSTTQSTAGITDTEDFDSLTGVHHCRIDLSADAFYAIGNDYQVVLSAATIDGQTVNAVIGHFSIENRTTLPQADAPSYDQMLAFFQLLMRSDSAIATDRSSELAAINANEGSGAGDYANTTESNEAIRDRGDSAWITGGGGSISDILNVSAVIPFSIDLANTATVRLGLMLINALDDLPSTAEITPGTISIHRKAIGGTSWTAVVTDAACSEQAGLIYYDEVFDSGSGYAEGDSIRVTFKGQKITVSANDYEITDSNGVMFQTSIRQTMRGTNGANTTTPPTANENADALLKRDWTAVTGEAARSMLNALRFLRNKWSVSGSTLTVTKEDDSTSAWTATLSTDAAADPVTGSDPT